MSTGPFSALLGTPEGAHVLGVAGAVVAALVWFVASAGEPGIGGAWSAYTLCFALLFGTLSMY